MGLSGRSSTEVRKRGHPGEAKAWLQGYRDQLRGELQADRLLRFGVITAEFALIVGAFWALKIESASVDSVLLLALAGFVVNHFLPAAWRQPFFAALSVGSIFLIFGWTMGAWLLGLGCLLIALCHVPVPFVARIGLIAVLAGVLALDRARLLPWTSPLPPAIWAILGSMFMFRLIVYLYDLRYRTAPFSVSAALSYFFMMPNVCLPLFPVVDYRTFQRSVYNDDALRLYQTGVRWMLRAVIHLLLYKVVYLEVAIGPADATTGSTAAQYIFGTFLLYLKVSGLFHLVVGLLHMYGFGLPETHHLYFFASSFTDLWRRINIYWKDFIQKIFFNPAYFAMRKLGEIPALVAATLVAFVATWFFHAYQWFWIRGEFPVPWSDLIFWFGLGLILLVNMLIESRKGRRRSLNPARRSLRENIVFVLKIAATFAALSGLWTIWSTPDFQELTLVGQALLNSGPVDLAVLIGVPIAVGVLGAMLGSRQRGVSSFADPQRPAPSWREASIVAVVSLLLIGVALRPTIFQAVAPQATAFLQDVGARSLNAVDSARLQRGYYEDLADLTRFNGELWTIYNGKPEGWNEDFAKRDTADARESELIPFTAGFFKGAWRTINSRGMRDREYSLTPAPGVFRIALVGASHDYGSGVADDETYENIVEDRLNKELAQLAGRKYEILNFSFGGADPTQKLAVVEQRVFAFRPDLILLATSTHEFDKIFTSAASLAKHGLLDQFPFVKSAMEKAGLSTRPDADLPSKDVLLAKLAPYAEGAVRAALERFRDESLAAGIKPAIMVLEIPGDSPAHPEELQRPEDSARSAGLAVINLRGAFASVSDRKSLWLTSWDSHTNAAGHRLIAEKLYSELTKSGLIPVAPEDAADRVPKQATELP